VAIFTELQKRLAKKDDIQVRLGSDEILVADPRARMTPANYVEQKLRVLTRAARKYEPSRQ
jgi:hypothetical protein